jgi:hypothetical protein
MTETSVSTPGFQGLLDSIGTRARRRGEPRATTSVAAAGCGVAIVGVLLISADTGIGDGGDFNRWPGTLFAALVVIGGAFLARAFPKGPLATTGTVAIAVGLPVLIGFATFEPSFPPFSPDAVLYLSTLGWLAAYVAGPTRGRPVLLGAALVGAWLSVLQLIEQPFNLLGIGLFVFRFSASSDGFGDDMGDDFGGPFGGGFHVPDVFVIGILSLGVALAYALMTRWLDGRRYSGAATPFALATIPALSVGLTGVSVELSAPITGVLYMVAGAALAHHGATLGRRATTWIGALAVANGAFFIVIDAVDSAASAGTLFLLIGLGTVAASTLVHARIGEPSDTQMSGGIRPFRRTTKASHCRGGSMQPSAPPPGPAGVVRG